MVANDVIDFEVENKKLKRKIKLMEQTLNQFNSIKQNYDFLIKKLEEKDKNLNEINEKLEELVKERTKDLELINEKLQNNLILLEELSTTDALTSLRNRRGFDEIFLQEFNRAKRQNYEFNFLLIDVDYFKKYNDTYGHAKGDEALVSVGKV
ncbi:GGDEF domain-containing protein [Malaciobacter mytili]